MVTVQPIKIALIHSQPMKTTQSVTHLVVLTTFVQHCYMFSKWVIDNRIMQFLNQADS